MFLPRQARDKHSEKLAKKTFFPAGERGRPQRWDAFRHQL
jgi:hypothetical protein